ncbi:zf-HC2 domain-containing protein [Kitasatospora sp. NPDC047058]|uniref:zf-HC2 domain-containing protein n=1 Tax=Kitasatospora sp. NPDC047058 TaxID=3155620 RepID=UPI003402907F
MRCAEFRAALSARLDGEPTGVPGRRLDKHVARCTVCREWLERAERLRGVLPAAGADGPSEDWTARLLARLGTEGPDGHGGHFEADADADADADPDGGGSGDRDGGADGDVGAAGRSGQGNGGPVR